MKKYLFLSLIALVILSTAGITLAQTAATATDQPPVSFFQFLLSKIGLATLPSNVVPLSAINQTAAVAGSGSTAGGVTATPAGSLTTADAGGVTVGGGVVVQPANACGNTLTPIGSVNQTIRCAQMPDGSYKWVAAGNLLNDGTNVSIVNGSQGLGKVLTSDANGLASWQALNTGGSSSGPNVRLMHPEANVAGDNSFSLSFELFNDGPDDIYLSKNVNVFLSQLVSDNNTISNLTATCSSCGPGSSNSYYLISGYSGGRMSIGGSLSANSGLKYIGVGNIFFGTDPSNLVRYSVSGWPVYAARISRESTGASQWTTAGNNIYNNNTGNVGVGTTNPAGKLDVAGTLGAVRVSTDGTEIQMTRSGFNYLDAINGNGALSFGTGGGTNKLVINSAGNVGIGTANPTEKLEVNGNVKMGYQLVTQTVTDQLQSLNVSCPSGKKVLGGGCNLIGSGTRISLLVSRPLNEDSWQCMWDGAPLPTKQAYAICANIR